MCSNGEKRQIRGRVRMRSRVAGTSFIAAIAAGIVVAATQAPLSPSLIGAAAPPAEALSL
jgi:hypothetical protein